MKVNVVLTFIVYAKIENQTLVLYSRLFPSEKCPEILKKYGHSTGILIICYICETPPNKKHVVELIQTITATPISPYESGICCESEEETFLPAVLVILKFSLRNYWKIRKNCFLSTTCTVMLSLTSDDIHQ